MSGGPACPNKDPEHVTGHHVVTQYRQNESMFSPGGWAMSQWSEISCFVDGHREFRWRTKAAYVETLPHATNEQRNYGVRQRTSHR